VSGGGGDRSGGGGGGDPGVDCSALQFDASVSSPQPNAVAALQVGEVLTVNIEQPGGARMIALRRANNDLVGSLTDRVRELIRCIQEGVAFEATVLSIQGGAVRLRVQAA
jgi:hypothetical protein